MSNIRLDVEENKLVRYNELLQEARTKTNKARDEYAENYVPMLYAELVNHQFEPYRAGEKVIEDCKSFWLVATIKKHLPPETKDTVKAESGRKSAEVKKAMRLGIKKYKILLGSQHIFAIVESGMRSEDGSVWLNINSTFDFISSEPGKPKPMTPIQVSSAPVRTT